MASDGVTHMAKTGTCRMCQRRRKTKYLKIVGEVRHGYATGHIWECINEIDCDMASDQFLEHPKSVVTKARILQARISGRWKEHKIFS